MDWYKNAVIYGLDVETFFDANGDGIGDFKGATARLDYLSALGITCIWVLPFYPTSHRDNGYDVIDYLSVDPRLGTLEDFRTFVRELKARNMRVLIDLVIHHTSDQHPWFMAATNDKNSKYYHYYVWTKQLPPKPHDKNIFPTEEPGVWHYNENAKEYFHHKFYHFEPDLNFVNPDVQQEIFSVIDYWLTFDIDGFRIDAATHLFDNKGIPGTGFTDPETIIERMRGFVQERNKDAIMLAEADVASEKLQIYIKGNDRFHLLFNFLLNNDLFLSLARKSAEPVKSRLRELSEVAESGHFANFVRNLDELDLEQLTDTERHEVYKAFAPEKTMRIYNRGIRRRIAPMLRGDTRRLKQVFAALFSFPGAPLFVYGDEIGMGEDLELPERISVRTPMQWDDAKNAGFSTADKEDLTRPVISEGDFSYKKIHVAQERRDKDSLLSFFRHITDLRIKHPEIGKGEYTIENSPEEVLVLTYSYQGKKLQILTNFSNKSFTIDIPLGGKELLSDSSYSEKESNELNAYGYRWYQY